MSSLLRKPAILWGGAIATLLCCFTPVLVVLFTLVGFGASVGYVDFALMPLLGFFITALARVYSWRAEGRGAAVTGGVALAVLGIFFGRFNLVFPLLIAAGAAVALLAYRKKGGVSDE